MAAVDAQSQIIVEAQAHGTGSEQEVLLPVVDAMRARDVLTAKSLITADAGYHSEANLQALAERAVPALIADADLREARRAVRDAGPTSGEEGATARQVARRRRARGAPLSRRAISATIRSRARACVRRGSRCIGKGQNNVIRGYVGEAFPRGEAGLCARARCATGACDIRSARRSRQVAFFRGRNTDASEPFTQQMKARIDTTAGRSQYAARFATVEPVFANLCYNKGLARFTLRGRAKVDGQWKLFCLVHNIEKLAHHGYAP